MEDTALQPDDGHRHDSGPYRWSVRWLGALAGTAVALAVATATGGRLAGWIAFVTCALLGVITFVTEAVFFASGRSGPARKSGAVATARWVVAAVAALASALVVEATVSHTAGAVLVAVALVALLGGAVTFAVRW